MTRHAERAAHKYATRKEVEYITKRGGRVAAHAAQNVYLAAFNNFARKVQACA